MFKYFFQYESLMDENTRLSATHQEVSYEKATLASAYNALYHEHAELDRGMAAIR